VSGFELEFLFELEFPFRQSALPQNEKISMLSFFASFISFESSSAFFSQQHDDLELTSLFGFL